MFLVWLRLKFLVQRLTHFLRAQKFTGPLSCQRLRGDRDARRALWCARDYTVTPTSVTWFTVTI